MWWLSAIIIIVLISHLHLIRKKKEASDEKERLELILESGNKQYEDVVKRNRELKFIKHDLNKQCLIISEIMLNNAYTVRSGHRVIDVILENKLKEAREKNIEFNVDVDRIHSWRISDRETISLFMNLLDNAIEASHKVEHNPFVKLSVIDDDGKHNIVLENSKLKSMTPLIDNMKTTKSDSRAHGYGIAIIREIVNRYGGSERMMDFSDRFYIEIRI